MKCNYRRNKKLTQKDVQFIQKVADEEFLSRQRELYLECQNDIACQLTAAVMVTLNQWYGWGPKRQRDFFSHLNNTYADLSGVGFTKVINPTDLVELVKEKFDIDLEKEISVELK